MTGSQRFHLLATHEYPGHLLDSLVRLGKAAGSSEQWVLAELHKLAHERNGTPEPMCEVPDCTQPVVIFGAHWRCSRHARELTDSKGGD